MCSKGYSSRHVYLCVCVCVCVCLCVKSHLTFEASVHLENAAMHSAGNRFVGFSLKLLRSKAMALPALYSYHAVGHFLSAQDTNALLKCHVDHEEGFG